MTPLAHRAVELDRDDPLQRFRDEFILTPGQVYLDGNSLGLASRRAETRAVEALNAWKTLGIGGWLDAQPPWFTLAEHLGERMSPLVGAEPEAVVVAGSTTTNLHQGLATLFRPQGQRNKILADGLAFPTDIYAIQSHLRLRGLDPDQHLIKVESVDGVTLDESAIIDAMTDDVALAVLPSVVYRSGQLLDLARLAAEARSRGVILGVDASHSVGAVPHHFDAWGVDFAFWCTYKYLNGGPGAVATLYVNRRHWGVVPGMAGWFGERKDRQFAMAHQFEPAPAAGGWQLGTPHILSMAPLLGSLELIAEAGIESIRQKSLALTSYLRELVHEQLPEFGCVTPVEDDRRGGHLALTHPDASRISRALRRHGVIPDHRPPDIVRMAPVALYTSFADVAEAVRRLRSILDADDLGEPHAGDLVS
jgi:kynureninase